MPDFCWDIAGFYRDTSNRAATNETDPRAHEQTQNCECSVQDFDNYNSAI